MTAARSAVELEIELAGEVDALETLPRADPIGADTRAERAAALARELRRPDLEMRARLVCADVLERQGEIAEAGRLAHAVQGWATEHSARYVLARSHYVLAAVHTDLGDYAQALEHAVRCVDLLGEHGSPTLRVDHLARLADAVANSGDQAGARDRYPGTLRLAADLGDVDRQLLVLNNWAYSEVLAGAFDEALRLSLEMQAVAARHSQLLHFGRLDTVARALMGSGRLVEAEAALVAGLSPEVLQATPDGDALAVGLLTLAEVRRRLGRTVTAQQTLDECVRVCDQQGFGGVRVRAHEEQAHLHAACGRYREAYEEHQRFHTGDAELRSAQREARARSLHALYETGEARRQSRQYRELSLRDPLTGLYNRRYVDEELPRLLARCAEDGQPVTVALLDLDHFKRINDQLSHDVGDQVLRTVAGLLDEAAAESGDCALTRCFAARMGGEEFLLVLVGQDAAAGTASLEELRRAVAAHPWAPVTGVLPVTISIGAATSDQADQPELPVLLSRADEHLYRAKDGGRDRVVSDPH